jgi:hypothetical protein
MRSPLLSVLAFSLLSACQTLSSTKPVEFLDERSAMTVGSLKEPIELVPDVKTGVAARLTGKHISFAYLGPVEWDKSGTLEYGLWVHVAPGSGQQLADIRSPAAVTLQLDSGPVDLSPIDAPQLGRSAYQPVAAWGQTAYFDLNVATLKLMAVSQKLELDVKLANGNTAYFFPQTDSRGVLTDYLKARGITGD